MDDSTSTAERWLPVVGWEGCHEVSDQGRVRSVDRLIQLMNGQWRRYRGRILVASKTHHGHMNAHLYKGGQCITRPVHQLVLEAFIGPRPPGYEGCHNNGMPDDNSVNNLRWDTHSGNMLDTNMHGTNHHRNKIRGRCGHLLVPPNITTWHANRGTRGCLACERARSNRRHAIKYGHEFDFKATANGHYEQIMKRSSLPTKLPMESRP